MSKPSAEWAIGSRSNPPHAMRPAPNTDKGVKDKVPKGLMHRVLLTDLQNP